MDQNTRKQLKSQARKERDRLAGLFAETDRRVKEARRALKDRHGAHATDAMLNAEERRIRAEAFAGGDVKRLSELNVQLRAAAKTRPDVETHWRSKLPRRFRRIAPPKIPDGYITDREQTDLMLALVDRVVDAMDRFTDLQRLERSTVDELVMAAHEAQAENDLFRFADVVRELDHHSRSGTAVDQARREVAQIGADIAPAPELQDELADLDAIEADAREIEQSVNAIMTGKGELRTAESARLVDDLGGHDEFLDHRRAERGVPVETKETEGTQPAA